MAHKRKWEIFPQDFLKYTTGNWRYLAQEKDGRWFCCADKPVACFCCNSWHLPSYPPRLYLSTSHLKILWDGQWYDSLHFRHGRSNELSTRRDLIFEIIDDQWKWIARDQKGRWWAYESEPLLSDGGGDGDGYWQHTSPVSTFLPFDILYFDWWYDSLYARPPISHNDEKSHESVCSSLCYQLIEKLNQIDENFRDTELSDRLINLAERLNKNG